MCLIIKGGNLTARTLARTMRAFLHSSKKTHKRKQTVKQLARQGATLTNIEINDEDIKSFGSVARKYGIDFASTKDASSTTHKYLVFFKARNADSMTAAFNEFSARLLNKSA